MAIINIDLGTAQNTARVVDAVAAKFGYHATIDGEPNPETKGQFAKRMVIVWMKSLVREYEAGAAASTAFSAAADDVESSVSIS